MKRWQVRGEVLDSDEEDLCVATKSHGRDTPRKRTKIQHEKSEPIDEPYNSNNGIPGAAASDQEDDASHEAAPVQSSTNAAETEVAGSDTRPNVSVPMTNSSAVESHEESMWTIQKLIRTYDPRRELPNFGLSRARELVPVVSQVERGAVQVEHLSTFLAASSSAFASEDVELSHGDFRKSLEPAEPSSTPPTSEHEPVANLSSRASSPLSDLSEPPDSPPPFVDISRPIKTLLMPRENESLAGRDDSHVLDEPASTGLDQQRFINVLSTQGPIRRSLRARQEKQLHPYMYDKALYQRQCRERGMKPITLAEQRANETQEQSLSHDDTQQHPASQPVSSTTIPSSPFESLPSASNVIGIPGSTPKSQRSSDDELPDFHALISRKPTKNGHDRKRRKVRHGPTHADNALAHTVAVDDDEFMVPPSPPSSSRGSNTAKLLRPPAAIFRLPRGLSPKGLPTPQISSEARPSHRFENPISSVESSPPRTLRRSPLSRHATALISDDSSTEFELAPSEVEDRRLLKERRRIRGVLPASWLKIDLKAQKRQAAPASYESNDGSPPRTIAPTKGVARRIISRGAASTSRFVLEISDDDQSDRSAQSEASLSRQHALLKATPPRVATHSERQISADDMEVDWIDPMLAGSRQERIDTGTRHKPRSGGPRGLPRPSTTGLILSEELNGLRNMYGREENTRKTASRRHGDVKKRRRKPVDLSILDATASNAQSTSKLPQFVRLAARCARRATNGGRHSPSSKVIRLATRADTEEANATLHNWRQGTIKQIQRSKADSASRFPTSVQAGHAVVDKPREPLQEMYNAQNQLGISESAHKLQSPHAQASRHRRLPKPPTPNQLAPRTPRTAQTTNSRSDEGTATTAQPEQPTRKRVAPLVVRYRGAQLESLENPDSQQNRALAFERRIRCLTESVARRTATQVDIDLPMSRFLQGVSRPTSDQTKDAQPRLRGDGTINAQPEQSDPTTSQPANAPAVQPLALPHRPRKRRTRRLDTETREYRQPSEPLPDTDQPIDEPAFEIPADARPVLQGLGPVSVRYPVDFDIRPLPPGTYFHESTLIGSGDFAASLSFGRRDLDASCGTLTVHINGIAHSWSAWTEEVSSTFVSIPTVTIDLVQTMVGLTDDDLAVQQLAVVANVDHMLRSVVRFVSTCLHFYDPADRSSCIRKLIQLAEGVTEVANDLPSLTGVSESLRLRLLQYALVYTQQARVLSENSFVTPDLRIKIEAALKYSASKLASCLLPTKLAALRDAYETCRTTTCRESGIRDDESVIAGIVILYHSSNAAWAAHSSFWNCVTTCLAQKPVSMTKVSDLDRAWYAVYSLLPALDFDVSGMIITRGDRETPGVDWTLPKQLVERTLALYSASSALRGSDVNEYVRATLRRCNHLVTKWRWWKCEPLLGPVYDFFAHLGLGLLHKEDGRGSPDFLSHLATGDTLDLRLQPGDCSFHIFLKLLACTLRGLRHHGLYTDKKIGGIAWRFIPNHARVYRKDAEVKQTDLDALRNHCDLLSVLYFDSPPSSRPGINLLQDLVDHTSSHREACRISVKAWANLASFQASTFEPVDILRAFSQWYRDMIQTTVNQYRLARTEAEQQYAEAQAQGHSDMTEDVIERMISSNQRQIAVTLVDLLAAIKRVVVSASNGDVAVFLMETCEPWKAFDTFDPSERRMLSVFQEALNLTKALLDIQQKAQSTHESQAHSEDSQDYGDTSMFQEYEEMDQGAVHAATPTADVVELIVAPLNHLMSNAFGAELAPDDAFLTQLVDVWVHTSAHLIRKGSKTWHNLVDDYCPGAWFQLRDTDQHAKFTPYLLARIIENDANAASRMKQIALLNWLKSMVDRESKLKHQHTLTTAILNSYDDEPPLQNLPLVRSSSDSKYHVSLANFRQRRVAILSSVLSNMQEDYTNSVYGGAQSLAKSRRTYSEMLRQLMQTMKTNYQDLQVEDSSATAGSQIQGAYVDFIQQVVSCLQQYATDICPIDRFFVDSSAFPLPATDPAYVVGRLKSYAPKLYEAKTRKQLAVFVHTVAERAAVDGQQAYLVHQLVAAMAGTLETGKATAPTLRHVLLTAILPEYIKNALTSACAWILALPILEAITKTIARLLYDTDLNNNDSVFAVVNQMDIVLSSCQRVVAYALEHPGQLSLPHAQTTLSGIFDLCSSATTTASFLKRTTEKAFSIASRIKTLSARAKCITAHLAAPDDLYGLDVAYDLLEAGSSNWPDTHTFSSKQLQDAMTHDWSVSDGKYYVRRGNTFKEVMVPRHHDGAKEVLLRAIEKFVRCWDRCESRALGRVGRDGDGFGLGSLVV